MKDIDKWFAEQCGVEIFDYEVIPARDPTSRIVEGSTKRKGFKNLNEKYYSVWDYKKPDCREVIRERFFITTFPHNDRKQWLAWASDITGTTELCKTLAEAEIACCKAIYEMIQDQGLEE